MPGSWKLAYPSYDGKVSGLRKMILGSTYMNIFKLGIRTTQEEIRLLNIRTAGDRSLWELKSDSTSL